MAFAHEQHALSPISAQSDENSTPNNTMEDTRLPSTQFPPWGTQFPPWVQHTKNPEMWFLSPQLNHETEVALPDKQAKDTSSYRAEIKE